jgi:hypothetical protein
MTDTPPVPVDSTTDDTPAASEPVVSPSILPAGILFKTPSLSKIQALVATLAGIVSIAAGAFSVVRADHAVDTGALVTIVKTASSHTGVPDATIEVLTAANAIVATLTPDATGRAAEEVPEGVYLVRVSHPHYAVDVHRVQVFRGQTVEIRSNLRVGSSSSLNHAVTAFRKALRF